MSDWQPLLDGDDAARAWQAIDAIAATLAEPDGDGASLDRGSAGRALFFEYLARARDDDGHRTRSRELIDHPIDNVGALSADPGLYSGFCGVAWTTQHLLAAGDSRSHRRLRWDILLTVEIEYALDETHRRFGGACKWRIQRRNEQYVSPRVVVQECSFAL